MAAPVVAALKVAEIANQGVKKYVPGGWKTVIVTGLLVALILPLIVINAIVQNFTIDTGSKDSCEVSSGSDGGATSDNDLDGGGGSGGKPPVNKVDFPATSGDTIVNPVKYTSINSGWGPRNIAASANTFHDGTDMGAPRNRPILAMADGIVSMSKNATGSAEGSMLEIQHTINGEPYTSAYRHVIGASILVKQGDTVKAGQQIAGIGTEGYSTGYHLHFVVAKGVYHRYNSAHRAAGTVDSLKFLKSKGAVDASGGLDGSDFTEGVDPEGSPNSVECAAGGALGERLPGDGTTAWGDYENGKIPTEVIGKIEDVKIYKPAVSSFREMSAAYKKDNGESLLINKGYLTYDEQKKLYDAGKQVEKPGESVFGWGRVAELKVGNFDSKQYKWLVKNAEKYGWEQPSVYLKGGSAENANMWSYFGLSVGVPESGNALEAKNREIGKKLFEEKTDWPEAEWGCLVNLWHKESNWNHLAQNPISSAYGIPQSIEPWNRFPKYGADWKTNPEPQILWGFSYIKERYKTPCGAWAFWQETDINKKGGKHGGNWY